MKMQNPKRDSFWKRLTRRQLRVLRGGGDGDASSASSGSGTSTSGGTIPLPPPAVPRA